MYEVQQEIRDLEVLEDLEVIQDLKELKDQGLVDSPDLKNLRARILRGD